MVFAKAWAALNRLYSKHLLLTNIATTGTLMGLGDIIVQNIEMLDMETKPPHDWGRTGRMFTMGVVMGPFNHAWYLFLDKMLPAATGRVVFQKILADQLVAAPYFCSAFFMGMGTLEGKPLKESFAELKSKFWTVYLIDWFVWPPAQFINFYFLPTRLRVAYVAVMTLLWNTFLSWIKHREHVQEVKEKHRALLAESNKEL